MNMRFKSVFWWNPWTLADDCILLGLFKEKILLKEITSAEYFKFANPGVGGGIGRIDFCHYGSKRSLYFDPEEAGRALEARNYIIEFSGMEIEEKAKAFDSYAEYASDTGYNPYKAAAEAKKNKDASVVGRAVAGGIIAGPTGAIVGALSAVDKNNKKNN